MVLDLLRDVVAKSLKTASAALDEIHLAEKLAKAMLDGVPQFRGLKAGIRSGHRGGHALRRRTRLDGPS